MCPGWTLDNPLEQWRSRHRRRCTGISMDKRGLNMHIVLGHARVVETCQIKVHPAQFHFQLSHRKMQGKSIGTGEHASLQHLANNLLRWGSFCSHIFSWSWISPVCFWIRMNFQQGHCSKMYTHGMWSTILKFWITYSLLVTPNSYKNTCRAKELPGIRLLLRTKTKRRASRTRRPGTSGNVKPDGMHKQDWDLREASKGWVTVLWVSVRYAKHIW